MQAVKEEKAIKKADADDTVVLKAPKKPGAKTSAALSKENLLRPDDAEDEDPGVQQRGSPISPQPFIQGGKDAADDSTCRVMSLLPVSSHQALTQLAQCSTGAAWLAAGRV